jgi:hypothetical protein
MDLVNEGTARDVIAAALRSDREEFASDNPWPFLVGEPVLQAPRVAMRTLSNITPALRKMDTLAPDDLPPGHTDVSSVGFFVAPIRKRQPIFAEMISLGRTANNDIVIPDATISKFHAYFRVTDDLIEVVDAGSRNGTKVMGRAIATKTPAEVTIGTRIKFGSVDLTLRDARETWELIRKRDR